MMRILTFDIECAKTYGPFTPICNFGYAIVDEENNLIEKKDIVINPGTNFKLDGRVGRPDVKLHYTKEEYLKTQKFPIFYNRIKELLTQPDLLIINHAVQNDLKYLKNEMKRYHLKPFDFVAYDTADIYKQFLSKENQKYKSLSKITTELNVDSFVEHKADDDAYASYQVFHKICQDLELTPNQLILLSNTKAYSMMEEYKRVKVLSHTEQVERLIKNLAKRNINDRFKDKVVSVSRKIEEDLDLLKSIVQYIIDCSGTFTKKVSECNMFIHLENDNCTRMSAVTSRNIENTTIQLINHEELNRMMLDDLLG